MYGKRDSRGRFAGLPGGLGLGRLRSGFSGRHGRMGYDPSWAMGAVNVPVIGPMSLPTTISFDWWKGLGGMMLGKVGPGILGGILDKVVTGGSTWTSYVVGGLTGVALLSEKYRRNSWLVGFAVAALPDMLKPIVDGIVDAVVPGTLKGIGAPRRLTQREAQALELAQRRLLSGLGQGTAGSGGFTGREVMLPSDYAALMHSPLSGPRLNMGQVGSPTLRSIV